MTSVELDKLDSIIERADLVADFIGISRKKAYTIDAMDIQKMCNHIIGLYADIHVGNPPKEITLKGKVYEIVNPEKVGVGWHADFSKMDIDRDPVQLACMFYFPKGSIYGDVDENDNLLNPIKDRYNDFADHMELKVFLEACAFFLRKAEQSMRLSMAKKMTTEKVIKILSRIGINGKRSSISSQRNIMEETGIKQ
jgi:hypothetical protein